MDVYCPRCERKVDVRPEHLTPTIPPMVPNMPTMIWLYEVVGHRCEERDVQARTIADLAGA